MGLIIISACHCRNNRIIQASKEFGHTESHRQSFRSDWKADPAAERIGGAALILHSGSAPAVSFDAPPLLTDSSPFSGVQYRR